MKRFVFLGDSITDADHCFDLENLGEGYVRIIHERLFFDQQDFQVINKGFDGFTLPALKRLWKQQSDSLSPDLLTILIGINDVGVIHNTGADEQFALAEFRLGYEMFLHDIRKTYSGPIILMEPFVFSYPAKYLNWFDTLRQINQIILDLSKKFDLIHIPLWDALLQMAETYGNNMITTDGIHLTARGHNYIAETWLEAVEKTKTFSFL